MLGQKREHAARPQQMTGDRLHIQQTPLAISPTLHPTIIAVASVRTRDRRAGYSAVS